MHKSATGKGYGKQVQRYNSMKTITNTYISRNVIHFDVGGRNFYFSHVFFPFKWIGWRVIMDAVTSANTSLSYFSAFFVFFVRFPFFLLSSSLILIGAKSCRLRLPVCLILYNVSCFTFYFFAIRDATTSTRASCLSFFLLFIFFC